MPESELERAEKRLAQMRARVQALRNREATKARKLDTRRKVILGGALIELAARDDGARAMLDRLVRGLAREQDRAAFDGWAPQADGSGGEREDASPGDPSREAPVARSADAVEAEAGPSPDEADPSPRERHRRTFL